MKHMCWVTLAALAIAAGCGNNKPEPKKGGDWMDNLKVENPDAEPDLSGADEDPAPAASGATKPEPPKPDTKIKPQTGRPLIQYGPKSSIESTFGATPGSKLQLTGGTTLIIPEYALDGGYNISWKVSGSKTTKGDVVGSVAFLKVASGKKPAARKVKSRKEPFQIRIGTGGAETINLAIGEVASDANGNETGKPTWTVVAPAKVDKAVAIAPDGSESATYTAVFELEAIGPIMYLHGTTADPG